MDASKRTILQPSFLLPRAPAPPSPKPPSPDVENPALTAARLASAQRDLLSKRLFKVPKHRICLRRSKYMVIRTASRELRWRHVKEDREATMVWLDRWENGDLMNLAPPRKVRRWAPRRTEGYLRHKSQVINTHPPSLHPPPFHPPTPRLATSWACPRWAPSAPLGAR